MLLFKNLKCFNPGRKERTRRSPDAAVSDQTKPISFISAQNSRCFLKVIFYILGLQDKCGSHLITDEIQIEHDLTFIHSGLRLRPPIKVSEQVGFPVSHP